MGDVLDHDGQGELIDVGDAAWWLCAIAELDRHRPGFAGYCLRAGRYRRQVIAACLALIPQARLSPRHRGDRSADVAIWPSAKCHAVAEQLMSGRDRELLQHWHGSCPPGLRGALAKLGREPLHQLFYWALHDVFADPANRGVARVLRYAQTIDPQRLRMAKQLPPPLQRPGILDHFATHKELQDFAAALRVISQICPGADEAALARSVKELLRGGTASGLVAGWLRQAPFPTPPIPGDEEVKPIASARDLERAAVRHQNCLKDRLLDVIGGKSVFYECDLGGTPTIAHIWRPQRRPDWLLEDVYTSQNGDVPSAARRAVERWFRLRGVTDAQLLWRTGEWRALYRVFQPDPWLNPEAELLADIDELLLEPDLSPEP